MKEFLKLYIESQAFHHLLRYIPKTIINILKFLIGIIFGKQYSHSQNLLDTDGRKWARCSSPIPTYMARFNTIYAYISTGKR